MKDPPFPFILYWKDIPFGRGEIFGLPLITRRQRKSEEKNLRPHYVKKIKIKIPHFKDSPFKDSPF